MPSFGTAGAVLEANNNDGATPLSVPLHKGNPSEITRESLVKILEIMYRLAAPEKLPQLLREIVEVGKVAIVADAGLVWELDRESGELVLVVPSTEQPARLRAGEGLAGECARTRRISNVGDFRRDRHATPPGWPQDFAVRSVLNVPVLGREGGVLGVIQWLGASPGQFDGHDEWIAPALSAQAAIAIQHARMTDELLAHALLRHEIAVAREIQMSTLPERMPSVAGYDVHGRFLPTDATGGDLYDLVLLDGRLFILLGDATGHGFGPALSATQMQAMLRVAFRLGADLQSACLQVNNQLAEDLPDDRFITAFAGFLDPRTHEVQFHSGGQGPILHFKAADGTCDWHKPTSFPLGIAPLDDIGRPKCLPLRPGDVLGLISDGIYEYAGPDGSQFGEARVAEVIRSGSGLSMAELSERLVAAAVAFGRGTPQADDITVVLLKRLA